MFYDCRCDGNLFCISSSWSFLDGLQFLFLLSLEFRFEHLGLIFKVLYLLGERLSSDGVSLRHMSVVCHGL